MGYKEDNWSKNSDNWKEATIQRKLERGSRGIAVVRNRYQATACEDTEGCNIHNVCPSNL
jgi:hypothetical protein